VITEADHSQALRQRESPGQSFAGFRWVFDLPTGQAFDEPLVLALRDAFATAAKAHARAMEIPYIAVQFALMGENLVRIKSSLSRATSVAIPVLSLAVPSGRLGYVHLAAWPLLQAELRRRGIHAEGPALSARSPALPRRPGTARMRVRLFFDPRDVRQALPETWGDDPPATALELGRVERGGITMAGIDYLRSTGRTVYAWSATLSDSSQACEVGGRPPFELFHVQLKTLPPPNSLVPMFRAACLAAADEVVGRHGAEQVAGDLHFTMVENAAFIRPGARASSLLNASAYERFLAALTVALTKRGMAVRFDADVADLSDTLVRQTMLESDAYVLHEDCELEWSRIVQTVWREHDPQAMAWLRRGHETLTRPARRGAVAWTIEPGSPLARLAPAGNANADLLVYVAPDAALPPDRTRQARAWLEAVLNGGPNGTQRAIRELRSSRQLGTVAVARALAGAYLARPLPARLHSAIERFRLECAHRLRDIDLVGADNQLVASLTDVLLASLREPAVAADLWAVLEAVLEHLHLPRVLVLGRQRHWLLPIPRLRPQWTELVRDHLKAGFEEDLGALWADDPQCLYPPEYGQESLIDALRSVDGYVDVPAVQAFTGWALGDAQRRRAHGVRGAGAYVTIDEPLLIDAGLTRAFFLRETPTHVVVRCDWGSGQRRCALRIPRSNSGWDIWAQSDGGALLAAYLAGAYRDMVVSLELEPFAEQHADAPARPDTGHSTGSAARLQPVGYIPHRHSSGSDSKRSVIGQHAIAPHGVTWYIRRLPVSQHASPQALAHATTVGMVLPHGFTFVEAHVWPRSADIRSLATALHTTIGLSNLRAILQADRQRRRSDTAPETDP
jgi:hypothetical protein